MAQINPATEPMHDRPPSIHTQKLQLAYVKLFPMKLQWGCRSCKIQAAQSIALCPPGFTYMMLTNKRALAEPC